MTARRPVVVHVITRLIVGGAQQTMLGLCDGLREHFDVRAVCGPETGVEGSLQSDMAAVVPLTVVPQLRRDVDPHADAAAVRVLRRHYGRVRPAIVHTHSSKAGIVGRVAARPGDHRIVHTIHGWGHTPDDTWLRRSVFVSLERVMERRTDALVAVSEDVRREGLSRRIGRPAKYRVIGEHVNRVPRDRDFASARREARRRIAIGEEVQVVGWVGRFVSQKDPTTLIGALAQLLHDRPTLVAVLVGDGPLRNDVVSEIRAAGLAHRVRFTGLMRDVHAVYPAFDVLLHPSRWEGEPRVIREALSERVPVVATRTSGVSHAVVDGVTGYVVQPGDPNALAQAAAAALDTPALRPPLDAPITRSESQQSAEAVLDRHRELYYELLARP